MLEKVNVPDDLKQLSIKELEILSDEIREIIIEVVSKNGGHLSSNLGVVDLTLALHRVFNTPADKIIWDVGHQSYTHKIVTGRKKSIFTIRQKGGLSGYPDINESKYDCLNTGHASTSLAFASGMAVARDLEKKDFNIVAVLGDGALTGGMALEALSHIGQVKQRLIIVLNDNKMSISPNVGGISKHLNYLVSGRPYIRLKEILQSVLSSIPAVGKSMMEVARKIEILIRTMMVPGSLFDELGVKYIGPINGHNIKEMIKEFEEVKKYDFPILLHVVTKKGQGYKPAVDDPSSFHSSKPFDIQNGKFIKSGNKPSYSKIFGQTVLELVKKDKRIIALTAAMPEGTGLDVVQREFPENFFDVGIAEQYMFDFAGGLSLGGMKPVIGIYSTFMQRAVDQIIHDFTLMKIPVVVGVDRAGLVGDDGSTHQGIYDVAILRSLPGVVIMSPKDENELQHMVYTGIQLKKIVFIRYPKEPGIGVEMDKEFREIPFAKSEILRQGKDAAIFAVGPLVYGALEAAEKLAKKDRINITVVNVRYIKPLDKGLILDQIKKTRKVITIEDGIKNGGFGNMVRELLISENLRRVNLLSLGVSEEIVEVASRKELLEKYHLDAPGIYKETYGFLKKRVLNRFLNPR
ncbi:MAG: 1-deoxy-D-xylulose-5-phosphate synthase [Candidatus Aminicenantes bacterium]|nr:1-deoxy-D-xylulose-5-phosphate synthase [Candidatus Aminicenantes bacterium]